MRIYVDPLKCDYEYCGNSGDFKTVEEAVEEGWLHLEHSASGETTDYDYCSMECMIASL